MKLSRKLGSTSQIFQIFIRDANSTTGGGLTGLAHNTGSLTAYYHRDTDTTATAISLVDMTVGTFTSSGFKEIDSTNMPGWYQFCPPNASLASGATSVVYHLKGAAGMAPTVLEIDLLSQVDITSIAGTAQTARDIGASVLLSPGTGTGQISLSSGAVTVGTNNDKTGYSLSTNDSPITHSGTAQSGSGTTITLTAGASSVNNFYKGQTIKLTGGTGAGQSRVIASYDGTTKVADITFSRAWTVTPDNTTTYAIIATDAPLTTIDQYVMSDVQGWAGTTLGIGVDGDFQRPLVTVASWRDTANDYNVELTLDDSTFSLPEVATKRILDYTTANYHYLNIDSGGRVDIGKVQGVAQPFVTLTGPVIAATSTTITLDGGALTTNDIYNGQQIKILTNTGTGQVRTIVGYVGSTKVATINRAWQITPDNTSTYAILGTDAPKINSSLEVTTSSITGVTFPTNFSALSITAGGLVDITQTAADKVWGTTTRRLSDGTNIVLAKGVGVTGFNDLSGSQIATAVWQDTTAGDFTVSGSIGRSLFTSGNVPGAAGGLFIAGTNAATTVTTAFTTTFTGNLTGSVGSVASGGITRASFADDTGWKTVRSNTAQAGGSTTITLDASASSTNNFYNNQLCYITGGTGIGQSRFITAYNGTTKVATVNSAWATNPDNTSTFAIIPFDSIPGATAPTASQVATAVWTDLLANSDFSTASSIGKLLKDNLDAAVSSRMATFTLPTNFSSLSINGSGLVDITQTAADKVWSTTTRILTAGTNIVLAKGTGITGFNDIAATAIVSGGAITTSGGAVSTVTSVTNGVTVSTNNDKTGYSLTQAFPANFASLAINGSGQVTVGAVDPSVTATASLDPASITAIVTAVWQDTTAGDFTVAGSIGKSLFTGGNTPGASGGLFIAGTNAATTITGALTTTFTGNLTGSVNSVTTGVTVSTNNDKTGYSLTQAFPSNFSALSITAGGLVDITQTAADKAWSTASRTLTAATNLTGMSVNVASYSAGQAPLQPTVSGRTLNVSASGLGDSDVKALNGDTAAAVVQSSANKVIYKGSVTSTTGPTSITDSALPNVTNNNWKGRVIVFLTGSLQYQATEITANTGTTLNFTALTGTPSVSDEYLIF